MHGQLATVLILSVALGLISITAQQKEEPPNAGSRGANNVSIATQNAPQRGGPAANQQPTPPPLNITVASPQKSAEELNAERRDREREIDIQAQIGKFTGLLVLVGVLQILAMIFGLAYTARAANAAKTSAEAADRSAKTSQAALTTGHRAYVDVIEVTKTAFDATTPLGFTFKIANAGKTPAHIIGAKTYVSFPVVRLPPNSPIPSAPTYERIVGTGPQFPIRPGGLLPKVFTENRIVTGAEFDEVHAKSRMLLINGFVDYRDVFQAVHRRCFGFVWDVDTNQFIFPTEPGYNTEQDLKNEQQAP